MTGAVGGYCHLPKKLRERERVKVILYAIKYVYICIKKENGFRNRYHLGHRPTAKSGTIIGVAIRR